MGFPLLSLTRQNSIDNVVLPLYFSITNEVLWEAKRCRYAGLSGLWIDYVVVVWVYDDFDIGHTAVTQFDIVLVEYFVEFVLFLEVFFDEVEKEYADVGRKVFVVWRVKPDDFAFPVSAWCG